MVWESSNLKKCPNLRLRVNLNHPYQLSVEGVLKKLATKDKSWKLHKTIGCVTFEKNVPTGTDKIGQNSGFRG